MGGVPVSSCSGRRDWCEGIRGVCLLSNLSLKGENPLNRVVIFGAGKSAELVVKCLNHDKSRIVGYIDNNPDKQGGTFQGAMVYGSKDVGNIDFNYVVVSSMHYDGILEQLRGLRVAEPKIVVFFAETYIGSKKYENVLDPWEWKYVVLEKKFEMLERKMDTLKYNLEYEMAQKLMSKSYFLPKIKSGEEAVQRIIDERCSISRFGDGEFELMAGRVRPRFQQPDERLALRLKEVLHSNRDNLLIAIADTYGALDQYEGKAAEVIREYMTPEVRDYHYSVLDKDRVYYDTYLSRPYIIYKDKSSAKHKFEQIKRIWEDRNVIIVEGELSRFGVGNALLERAKSIRRILCPSKNAFARYGDILERTLKEDSTCLYIIALGPTATVLAYDLALAGYQAIDMGQVDLEYEWFLAGVTERQDISYKYVNEVPGGNLVQDVVDEKYDLEIIDRIS